jgi:hypothetical protein
MPHQQFFFFFSFGFDYYLVDVIQAKSNKQILLEAMKQILFVPDTTWNRLAYDLTRSKGFISSTSLVLGSLWFMLLNSRPTLTSLSEVVLGYQSFRYN